MIHKTAVIDTGAEVSKNAEIGPYVVIEKGVRIAPGVKIEANAYIYNGTEIGEGCQIHVGCVIGDIPQDRAFKNEPSFVKIGRKNILREYVTIHRGTIAGSCTIIGDENYLMTCSHVGHNCIIGNKVTLVSSVLLAGYVTLEDESFIGGNSAVHQFARIGRLAMVGGNSRVDKDVPPFMLLKGDSEIMSMNVVGLRRSSIPKEIKEEIKRAYKILYRSDLNTSQAVEKMGKLSPSDEIRHLIDFIKNSKRGICSGPRR
ncbi:MAG: acyl-ACP--UDP-N-acetylglucosamine O-acyltransferase [Candidatus Omnitrophica bacterium CG07_land_8_20_14_0_80_42_15]|uniref:Acyl-ACP--UDP-N-acetylglucosamine O-acyltransferase n=1 Tax=Candidatus Aquitaenariimonas noxiae TaxID=1974741 RepID=A0A2J0KRN9_9BACT|nr:MAG: acyl-ACP--UDP-N-acetylglucosamine O-acyltransferase [Candidatus Omnitrophica bacterium CG07_land_8_20_14_0_80_42_15]